MSAKTTVLSPDSQNQLPHYRADDRPANLRLTQKGHQAINPGPKATRLYTLTQNALDEMERHDRDEAYRAELALSADEKERLLIESLKRAGYDTSWMDEAPPAGPDYGGF